MNSVSAGNFDNTEWAVSGKKTIYSFVANFQYGLYFFGSQNFCFSIIFKILHDVSFLKYEIVLTSHPRLKVRVFYKAFYKMCMKTEF